MTPAGFGFSSFGNAIKRQEPLTRDIDRFDENALTCTQGAFLSEQQIQAIMARIPETRSLAAMMLTEAVVQARNDARIEELVPVITSSVMGVRPLLDRQSNPRRHRIGGGQGGPSRFRQASEISLFGPLEDLGLLIRGEGWLVSSGCGGGNIVIDRAASLVESGKFPMMVAAGVDELSLEVLNIFSSLRARAREVVRPFDINRDGTLPGEASVAFIVEDVNHAQERGATIYAEIQGRAIAGDAYHMVSPAPDARGLKSTVQRVMADAALSPDDIDWVCAHGTGTIANDAAEASTLRELLGNGLVISSLKAIFAHTQGAAACIDVMAAIWSMLEHQVPAIPTHLKTDPLCGEVIVPQTNLARKVNHVLSPAYGFGGTVATLIVGRPNIVSGQ